MNLEIGILFVFLAIPFAFIEPFPERSESISIKIGMKLSDSMTPSSIE